MEEVVRGEYYRGESWEHLEEKEEEEKEKGKGEK
jgi:hypothetical protein